QIKEEFDVVFASGSLAKMTAASGPLAKITAAFPPANREFISGSRKPPVNPNDANNGSVSSWLIESLKVGVIANSLLAIVISAVGGLLSTSRPIFVFVTNNILSYPAHPDR